MHSNSLNVSLVSLCDSFDALSYSNNQSVRVKGGMSLRNGMWHGLRNDIIIRNVLNISRMTQRNKLN